VLLYFQQNPKKSHVPSLELMTWFILNFLSHFTSSFNCFWKSMIYCTISLTFTSLIFCFLILFSFPFTYRDYDMTIHHQQIETMTIVIVEITTGKFGMPYIYAWSNYVDIIYVKFYMDDLYYTKFRSNHRYYKICIC